MQMELWRHLSDFLPRGLSKLLSERSTPEAARLSPRVSAPRDCSRRATAAAKRCSPPRLVMASLYMGAVTWQPHMQHEIHITVPSIRKGQEARSVLESAALCKVSHAQCIHGSTNFMRPTKFKNGPHTALTGCCKASKLLPSH